MKFWPFNRKKKPVQKRAYAGARYDRLTADWIAMGTSIDAEIKSSLPKLRNRSRQLGRDNDYIKNFFRAVQVNVVGRGIPFQSQVMMQRGKKLDENLNSLIEAKFTRWMRKEFCDVAGKLSFVDIQKLAIREVAESGDFFVRMIKQPFGGSRVPFALEMIEADTLDDNYDGIAQNGNRVRMGVEMNSWGRPTAYYFFTDHPGDYQKTSGLQTVGHRVRIDAKEIIPLFMTERAKQTRGVPWVAASIIRLHHMQGYEEAEVIAARASASLMGFIESEAGELKGDDVEANQRVTDFEPGVFKQMAPGEKVNVPDLHRPGGQFDPFMRAMLRGVAAGIGVSYETLARDYSQSNYSSSRLALIDDRDNWRMIQDWFTENFHQIVFENWLDMAVLSGELKLPDYETNPERYTNVRWMPRGWAWVDPGKEAAAMKELLRGGLTTQADILAQEGKDFEEVMVQRKREVDRAKELELVFDTDPQHDNPVPVESPENSPKDTENQ